MLLWIGGFLSALVSGITGMAGGTLLLSILSVLYDPITSIALHGMLQVFANLSRVFLFLQSVSWSHVLKFVILAIPGAYLGARVQSFFSPETLKALLGVLILYVALKPSRKNTATNRQEFIFVPLGFVSGFLGMIIGVTGPLLAPFFLRAGLIKERFVATKALCQFIVQLIKVAFFATLLQFDYTLHTSEIFFVTIMILVGTFCAKKLLPFVSERIFIFILKGILTILGIKLLLSHLLS